MTTPSTPAGGMPPGPGGVPATPSGQPVGGHGGALGGGGLGGLGGGAFGGGAAAAAAADWRPRVAVATYTDYGSAQRAVDYLSDNKFPVEHTAIIGTDLRLVENVIGRLTVGRAALAGLASGAWFGLFIGLLFGIFVNVNWFAVVFSAIAIGAGWGAIFGAIAQGMTGGRRDFASRSSLQAGQYAVTVDNDYADQARQLLTRLNWQTSGAG